MFVTAIASRHPHKKLFTRKPRCQKFISQSYEIYRTQSPAGVLILILDFHLSKLVVRVLENMGKSTKLGLRGRPQRPVGSLGTSKLWRVAGRTILCYPLIFSSSEFYLSHDMALLKENIKAELKFISRCWRLNGRPTFCILITEKDMRDPHFDVMRNFLADLRQGHCDGIKVRLGRVQSLLSGAYIEHLDFLSGHETFTEVTDDCTLIQWRNRFCCR